MGSVLCFVVILVGRSMLSFMLILVMSSNVLVGRVLVVVFDCVLVLVGHVVAVTQRLFLRVLITNHRLTVSLVANVFLVLGGVLFGGMLVGFLVLVSMGSVLLVMVSMWLL